MVIELNPAVPLWTVAALLIVVALKHYAADFVLQTNWMAQGKERSTGWLGPLAAHAFCHAAMTLVIALSIAPRLWWLAVVDVLVHFMIDRAKSLVSRWGQWTPTEAKYWWLMGFDQFLHQVTNVGLAAAFLVL